MSVKGTDGGRGCLGQYRQDVVQVGEVVGARVAGVLV